SDAFRVDVSLDCGETFTAIYEKDGLDLSTVGSYITSTWTPSSANDWRTEEIDLTAYEGENVLFRFININGYGNSTFIDNINVSAEILGTEQNKLFGVYLYPNPTSEIVFISLTSAMGSTYKIKVTNSLGQTIGSIKEDLITGEVAVNVSNYSSGLYFISIEIEGRSTIKKLLIE
ncbi:MAG: T9SS type A sorting domain-containing protein, partial [Bacteroidetes bacterium]|nr:T9SS type A sorting domain-containing protein [Bacteroidota bacterium]